VGGGAAGTCRVLWEFCSSEIINTSRNIPNSRFSTRYSKYYHLRTRFLDPFPSLLCARGNSLLVGARVGVGGRWRCRFRWRSASGRRGSASVGGQRPRHAAGLCQGLAHGAMSYPGPRGGGAAGGSGGRARPGVWRVDPRPALLAARSDPSERGRERAGDPVPGGHVGGSSLTHSWGFGGGRTPAAGEPRCPFSRP